MSQVILVYSGIKGYLDNLKLDQIDAFKVWLLSEIQKDKLGWLANFVITKKMVTKNLDFYITQKLGNFEKLLK
jgi:F0F1-type ATP synthase alpha subunit